MDQPEPLLVNRSRASSLLGMSERTLAELTRSGVIPAVRFGRTVRYNVEALKKIAEQGTASPAAAGG